MSEELCRQLILFWLFHQPLILFLIAEKVSSVYAIKNIYNQKKITQASTLPETKQKYDNIDLDDINNEEFKKIATDFAKLLVTNFSEENLVNFYNNINEVDIKKNPFIMAFGLGGYYDSKYNSMVISRSKSIYHELFHMASRVYDKEADRSYTGFSQTNFETSKYAYQTIGRGINEGYTELLTKRYFGWKRDAINVYVFETDIVQKLELIVGEEKMTSLYLEGNLIGLINELKQYAIEEEILKFITRVDLINKYNALHKSMMVRESIFDTYEFLLKTYNLKLKKQYEDGVIDLNTFSDLSNKYLISFKDKIKTAYSSYKLRNLEEFYNIVLENISAPEPLKKQLKR